KIQLGREADRALVRPPTEDLEAYQLYLRGRYYWERRYPGFFQHALQCFESAIARDASYALAYAGLADVYSSLGNLGAMPPGVAFGKAKSAAQRAVVLDDELAEAHQAMAIVHWSFDWDFIAAEREFRRTLDLNPNAAIAHAALGGLLSVLGRFDEAFVE